MEAIFKDIGRISIDNFVAKLKLQDEATRV